MADFEEATFTDTTNFVEANFAGTVFFRDAIFENLVFFEEMTFANVAIFEGVIFEQPVGYFSVVSLGRVTFSRTRFARGGTLRFAGGEIVLDDVLFDAQRVLIGSHNALLSDLLDAVNVFAVLLFPLISKTGSVFVRSTRTHYVSRLLSLRRVDASMLTLSGLNLSECSFDEVYHLDRLRFEQDPTFLWPSPRFFPKRRVLFQEARWRKQHSHFRKKWNPPPQDMPDSSLEPKDLAQIYRDFRKGREDEKNEPGAADFYYYDEMEMRRYAVFQGSFEKLFLTAYRFVSGYVLWPLRSLTALTILICLATLALNTYGIKELTPVTSTTWVPALGTEVEIDTIPQEPHTTPNLDGAFFFVIGSLLNVTMLDTGMLTTSGQATRVALRFLGPVLLGLTVPAVRVRVKR